jgi:hypothetical protein
MHGVLQIIEKALGWQKYDGKNNAVRLVRIVITFLLVNFAWVFFRMPNISDAYGMIARMFSSLGVPNLSDLGSSALFIIVVAMIIHIIKDLRDEFFPSKMSILNTIVVRWFVYVLLFCMILTFGVLDGGQFIYVSF